MVIAGTGIATLVFDGVESAVGRDYCARVIRKVILGWSGTLVDDLPSVVEDFGDLRSLLDKRCMELWTGF